MFKNLKMVWKSSNWFGRLIGIPTVIFVSLAFWFFVALVVTGFIQHHYFHMWY